MNTGQMLLVLAALLLLGMVTLAVNKMLVNKTTTMLEAEASLNAISLAQSMIDEIMTKSYDLATAPGSSGPKDSGPKVYDSTAFTAPASLGPSNAEVSAVPRPEPPDTAVAYKSVAGYNDVDDYNNYTRKAYTTLMGTFTLTDTVYYVSEFDPNSKSDKQTFHKKVVVTVRHPNMPRPLQLSDIAVYRTYF